MQLGILDQKHPSYDPEHWKELDALSKGGKSFKALVRRFLPQNPVEPGEIYEQRVQEVHYRSYMGSIINLYVGWLFASSFSVKAYDRKTNAPIDAVDRFYGEFQENVGAEMQLSAFLEERFRDALVRRTSHWLIELPSHEGRPAEDLAEFEARDLGHATLKEIAREDLFDWEEDESGNLKYAVVHAMYETRASWMKARDQIVEIWRVYEDTFVHTFKLTYTKKEGRPRKPETEVSQVGEPAEHGFKRVPVVRLCLNTEICIGEQVRDTQLEHFRQDNALSWLIRRTCYAQPVFNIEDGENNPPTMGVGHAIMLGKDDKMGWTAPPQAPFDILQKGVESKRDDIYRIVHQMAQAVDNNAETVGRSADSKEIDAAATRIMLNAYGKRVAEVIEETYELISEARAENYEWSVEGFSGYDTATVSSLIAAAKEARGLGIPSETFHKEICAKTALAMVPEADQRVKDKIRQEINEATYEVTSAVAGDAEAKNLDAQAKLAQAKADAEPIKAKAALKSASQPKPALGAPGKPAKKA